jgi:hypothetical protein
MLHSTVNFIPSRRRLTFRVELDLCSDSESESGSTVEEEEGKGDGESSMYSMLSLSPMMIDDSSRKSRSTGRSLGFPTKTVLTFKRSRHAV